MPAIRGIQINSISQLSHTRSPGAPSLRLGIVIFRFQAIKVLLLDSRKTKEALQRAAPSLLPPSVNHAMGRISVSISIMVSVVFLRCIVYGCMNGGLLSVLAGATTHPWIGFVLMLPIHDT